MVGVVKSLLKVVYFFNFLKRMSSSDAVTSSGSGVVGEYVVPLAEDEEAVTNFLNFSKAVRDLEGGVV